MRTFRFTCFGQLLALFLLSACDDLVIDKSLNCSAERIDFGAAQDAKILFIETGIDWKISSKAEWVELSVAKGKGSTGVLVGVSENTQFSRQDTISVVAGDKLLKIPISQAGSPRITFTTGNVSFTVVHVKSKHDWEEGFYMCETEVTNALWEQVTGSLPYDTIAAYSGNRALELPDIPVSCVSWNDVTTAFIPAINKLFQTNFSLPSETEWLDAAMGGKNSKNYTYAGSNSVEEVAWYADNSMGHKVAVKKLKPNEAGLYDMSGNVSEWTSDWSYPASDKKKVIRGGNYSSAYGMFTHTITDCVVLNKSQTDPSCYEEITYGNGTKGRVYRCATIGFRLLVPVHPD